MDYSLLGATSLSAPIHAHSWDPYTAYEFATVGAGQGGGGAGGGVSFWMLEEDMGGKKCQLKVVKIDEVTLSVTACLQVHSPSLPEALLETEPSPPGALEFTSVCHGNQPMLFVGSSNGGCGM